MRVAILPLILSAILVAGPVAAAEKKQRERDDAEKIGDPHDKMICKRTEVIGSLVATRKECRTAGLGNSCTAGATGQTC
jgi:hypothetical protein